MDWTFGLGKKTPWAHTKKSPEPPKRPIERAIAALKARFPDKAKLISDELSSFEAGTIAGGGLYHIVTDSSFSRDNFTDMGLTEYSHYERRRRTDYPHKMEFTIKEEDLENALKIRASGAGRSQL